jgi:hypothetical protein
MKPILVRSVEIVSFLFVTFGGFLAGIAPPGEADARFAVGMASFLTLVALLVISALARRRPTRVQRRRWLMSSIILVVLATASAITYKQWSAERLFSYPPESTTVSQIAGTSLTDTAKNYLKLHPNLNNAQLLARFGGIQNKHLVWNQQSINNSALQLIATYVIFVVTLASSIFALIEGRLIRS